jgi:hypothetical protein
MGLWLLSFTGRRNAAVVRAETLAQARLLAVADDIERASHFDEGFAIDPQCAAQILPSLIGRQLSGGSSRRSADDADDQVAAVFATAERGDRLAGDNAGVPRRPAMSMRQHTKDDASSLAHRKVLAFQLLATR